MLTSDWFLALAGSADAGYAGGYESIADWLFLANAAKLNADEACWSRPPAPLVGSEFYGFKRKGSSVGRVGAKLRVLGKV